MDFQLHRGEHARLGISVRGTYDDFDAALRARDDDVIAQLDACPSPPREITHLIIGPGLAGPRTPHVLVTFAGVDSQHPDPEREVAGIARWLREIHQH